VGLNFVFFTDSVSELYGQRMYWCLHISFLCVVFRKIIDNWNQSINQNFNILMSACLIDLLVLLKVAWLQLSAHEVRVLLFVADFPMPEVRVFCLCR
jgi:hypothetical protein